MEKPAEKPEVSTDEQLNKAQKSLKQAHDAQPMNAAKGALAGGVAATTASVGTLLYQTFKEFSRNANRAGMSILEMHNNKQIGNKIVEITAANPKSIAALTPYAWAAIAAPFAGSAVGAWIASKRGNSNIMKKHTELTNAMEDHWQQKVVAEKKDQPEEKLGHGR